MMILSKKKSRSKKTTRLMQQSQTLETLSEHLRIQIPHQGNGRTVKEYCWWLRKVLEAGTRICWMTWLNLFHTPRGKLKSIAAMPGKRSTRFATKDLATTSFTLSQETTWSLTCSCGFPKVQMALATSFPYQTSTPWKKWGWQETVWSTAGLSFLLTVHSTTPTSLTWCFAKKCCLTFSTRQRITQRASPSLTTW